MKRAWRRHRLFWRLRRQSARPSIATEFRWASLSLALCLFFVLAAQALHVSVSHDNQTLLDRAARIDQLAHRLSLHQGQFHVAAVDLINEANEGSDSPLRIRQMATATEALKADLGELRQLVPSAAVVAKSAHDMADIDVVVAKVMRVSVETDAVSREALEGDVARFLTVMERDILAMRDWATDLRQNRATAMHRYDDLAMRIIVGATLLALVVGAYFYRRLVYGVFPVANQLRRTIVDMANGKLDDELNDQRFAEPQQMTLALRKLRAAARRERQFAWLDFLTELPNRRALADRLSRWPRGQAGSLLIIDVDGFKQVNDSFGHPVGDELVRCIGRRLVDAAPNAAMVARLGGDEFAVLLPHAAETDAETVASRIVALCAEPLMALGVSLSVTVSVGITRLDPCDRSPELSQVLRSADLALYAAKSNGRNGFAHYVPQMRQAADLLELIESDLDGAISDGGLSMAFQPIVAISGAEKEVEALLRWSHPVLGPVNPEQIIEVAERAGKMERLGQWILAASLDALVDWPGLTISMNLSPRQLRNSNFAAELTRHCRDRGIAPQRVMLEITESVALDQLDQSLMSLSLLQTIGFRIALDDFGKGYSSLWMLKQFAFNRLKIDRSLVEDVELSAQARAVLAAAVNMGRELGMEIVAEGVDSDSVAAALTAIGCTHLQGYLFSRPLDAENVAAHYAGPNSGLRLAG